MLEIKTGRATSDTKGLAFWFGGSRKSTLGLDPLIYSQWVIALESQCLQGLALEMIGTKPVLRPVSD
jgi:hypothetical protein